MNTNLIKNLFKNYIYENNNFYIFLILSTIGISIKNYRMMCNKLNFDYNNEIYKLKYKWEEELEIFEISMPRFFINTPKKKKCLLLIGGFKDIPYVWNELEKLLNK